MKAVQRNLAEALGVADLGQPSDAERGLLNSIWQSAGLASGGWKDADKVSAAMELAQTGEPF